MKSGAAIPFPAMASRIDAKIEAELLELDDESAAELLESIGQTERGLDALARAGFELGQVPLAAIEAGGGSLRCCVAEVF